MGAFKADGTQLVNLTNAVSGKALARGWRNVDGVHSNSSLIWQRLASRFAPLTRKNFGVTSSRVYVLDSITHPNINIHAYDYGANRVSSDDITIPIPTGNNYSPAVIDIDCYDGKVWIVWQDASPVRREARRYALTGGASEQTIALSSGSGDAPDGLAVTGTDIYVFSGFQAASPDRAGVDFIPYAKSDGTAGTKRTIITSDPGVQNPWPFDADIEGDELYLLVGGEGIRVHSLATLAELADRRVAVSNSSNASSLSVLNGNYFVSRRDGSDYEIVTGRLA